MNREAVLEVGFVLVAIGFLSGLGVLVGGRFFGERLRRRGFDEIVPPGMVPGERHQHLSPSAR